MNQRYIDFVPNKRSKKVDNPAPVAPVAVKTVPKSAIKNQTKPQERLVSPKQSQSSTLVKQPRALPRQPQAPVSAKAKKAQMEASIRTVKAENLTKKPLFSSVKTAKTAKIAKPVTPTAKAPATKIAKPAMSSKAATFQPPKFINTNKVEKRPLSKTAYPRRKDLSEVEEIPSGPIAIIDRPEDNSNTGLIITVILTVILGTAVGTIAFLLIPR